MVYMAQQHNNYYTDGFKTDRREFIFRCIPGVLLSAFTVSAFASSKEDQEYGSIINKRNIFFPKLADLIRDKKKPVKWLFTGDSITQGAKHTLGFRAYPEIFSERIRFEMNRSRDIVINTAVSGNTTADILNDFDWRVKQSCPDVISLMIGTNDAAVVRNISVDMFKENLETLIDKFKKLGAVIILQTPNIIIKESEQGLQRKELPVYIRAIRETALENKILLIDHWQY